MSAGPRDQTVRKGISDDCLVNGELHVSVAERLDRIQQLPVNELANLRGVVSDEKGMWLVWQYIPGITLQEFLSQSHSDDEVNRILREVRHVVTAMHGHGIVHGAIHPRNIIIDPQGRIRLTHVSPLLHDDPAADHAAIDKLVDRLKTTLPTANSNEEKGLRLAYYLLALFAAVMGILIFLAILWYIRDR